MVGDLLAEVRVPVQRQVLDPVARRSRRKAKCALTEVEKAFSAERPLVQLKQDQVTRYRDLANRPAALLPLLSQQAGVRQKDDPKKQGQSEDEAMASGHAHAPQHSMVHMYT